MKPLSEFMMTEKVEQHSGEKFFVNHPISALHQILPTLEYRTVRFIIWPRMKMFVYWDAANMVLHGAFHRHFPGVNPNDYEADWKFGKNFPTGFIGLDRERPEHPKPTLVSMFYQKYLENAETFWKDDAERFFWMSNYITRIKAASSKVFIQETTGGFTGYTGNDTH
jgi:hypothetical protein